MSPRNTNTCCGFPFRSSVKYLASFEIVRNATAIVLNVSTFAIKINCWLQTQETDICQFLCTIFERLEIEYTGWLGAFLLVFSVLQLYVAVLCYKGAKERSLEKCQSAFICLVILWILGLIISIYIVDKSPLLIWAVIIIYSLRLGYMTIVKKYVNELRSKPLPVPV